MKSVGRTPLAAAILTFACATKPAPAVIVRPTPTAPPAPPASAALVEPSARRAPAESPKPACGANDYTEADIFDRKPDRRCEPPAFCSAAYWEHLKARATQAGPPPDAKTMAQGSCVVRTEHATLDWVTVTPDGDAPFVLRVDDALATVLPGVGNDGSDVAIRGLLSFYGRSRIGSFGVDRGLSLAGGRLHTGARTRAVPTALAGRGARVDLLLADDVTAKDISLPCTSLHASAEPYPPAMRAEMGVGKELQSGHIQLFATANGSTAVDITTPFLLTFEAAGGRVRVAQRMDDGGELHGWVPAAQLAESEGGGGQGYGIGGSACGCPGRGGETRIRVAVSAGTTVFSRAGDGRWAAFTRAAESSATEIDAEWLRLEGLTGVAETYSYPGSPCNDVRAFVRRKDVRVIAPER